MPPADPITLTTVLSGVLKVGTTLRKADEALESHLGQTSKFIQARDQMYIEWWGEVVSQVRDLLDLKDRLEAEQVRRRFLEDEEGMALLANYGADAYAAPLAEHRRMLTYAAAGLANLDLSIAEHVRVWRTLKELDPDDLIMLYRLRLVPGRPGSSAYKRFDVRTTSIDGSGGVALKLWEESRREALLTSGCIRILASGGGAGMGTHELLRITDTGLMLLKVLRPYILVRKPDLTSVPGHEETQDFRSEDEARRFIDSIPGLRGILLESVAGNRSYVLYHGCKVADGEPANGRAMLNLHLRNSDDAQHICAVTGPKEQAEAGEVVQGIYVDLIDHRPHEQVEHYLHLAGPHDVLRWLAYDINAVWV